MNIRKENLKRILKILARTIIVLVIGCVIFLCAFTGYVPVVGRLIAEFKLSSYAGHKVNVRFDGLYVCGYYDVGSGPNHRLRYYLKDNTIYHLLIDNKISGDANERYGEFLKSVDRSVLELPEELQINSRFDADDTSRTFSKICVYGCREAVRFTEEESREHIVSLARQIIDATGVNCTGLLFRYCNMTGRYEINIDLGTRTVDGDALREHLVQDEGPDPEDYLEWVKECEQTEGTHQ